jgi:hypothetical protein
LSQDLEHGYQDARLGRGGTLRLAVELPNGVMAEIPLQDGVGTEHGIVSFCRGAMPPHLVSVCARHTLKYVKDHNVKPVPVAVDDMQEDGYDRPSGSAL